jgi:Mg2+-importing ATPase
MIQFGVLSSLFDFLTFATLLKLFQADERTFRTGWFVESLLTELVIALVVRTRRPSFRSRPGTALLGLTVIVAVIDLLIPYLPYASVFGFTPLPLSLLGALLGITALYIVATELLKLVFYRRIS